MVAGKELKKLITDLVEYSTRFIHVADARNIPVDRYAIKFLHSSA